MNKMQTVLKWVVDKGYTIDKDGVVRNPNGNILKGSISDKYLKFSVRTEFTSSYSLRVHKFQAYIKFGDKIFQQGIVVRHLNGNSLDNSWDNIVLGTQSQNIMDRSLESRKNHIKRKEPISDEIINAMIVDKNNGLSYRKLVVKYNIPKSTIMDRIKNNL